MVLMYFIVGVVTLPFIGDTIVYMWILGGSGDHV